MVVQTSANQESFLRIAGTAVISLSLSLLVAACGGSDENTIQAATWATAESDLANEDLSIFAIPKPDPAAFANQTVRQISRISVGGDSFKIKFSNRLGDAQLVLDKIHVAKSTGGASIDPSTDHAVTFAGGSAAVIPAGQELWSDAINIPVAAQAKLAVSMYINNAAIGTAHRYSNTTTYVATGDQTSTSTLSTDPANTRASSYFLQEISVQRSAPTKVVVAFGDSISDGTASTKDGYMDWPDQLSNRALQTSPNISVINVGLAGNRWLHDVFGPNGVSRFPVEALGTTGVTDVIILLGINDIGLSEYFRDQAVTSDQIIAAMTNAIAQANAKNVKVFMGTLMPYKGSAFYNEIGEAKRQAVNTWIRSNTLIAGVIDFDKVMQDPADPQQLRNDLQSGDHIHPNDLGYTQMAGAVNVALF